MSEQPIPLTDTEREALAARLRQVAWPEDSAPPWKYLSAGSRDAWLALADEVFARDRRVRAAALAPIQALAEEWRAQPPALVHESLGSEYVGEYYITALGTALAAAGVDAAPNERDCSCENVGAHRETCPWGVSIREAVANAAPNEMTTEALARAWDEGVQAVGDQWADDAPLANPYRAAVPSGHEQEGDQR